MKYYCETIPVTLAEKLKEKGMPMEESRYGIFPHFVAKDGVMYFPPTFASTFDWLMSEKGVYIFGFRRFDNWRWAYATEWRFRIELEDISQEEVNGYIVNGGTWHEAANAAIEKALTLI